MYNLFNDDTHPYTGDINISILNFVKGNLARELNKVIMYYRNNVHAVQSNHFLTRIMNHLPYSSTDDMDYWYSKLVDASADLSRVLKITSPVSKGEIHEGLFYGTGTHEILVSVTAEYDSYRTTHWSELKPLRVLSHPRSSLLINPIENRAFENEVGLAVILIDMPMLMVQYRKWRTDTTSFIRDDSDRSLMQFIAMYPLTNLLYSHMDVAIFNRIAEWRYGNVPNDDIPRFPIAVINFSDQIDKVLISLNDLFDRHRKEFEAVLRNIPAVSSDNYLNVIQIPPMAITRNVKWALLISRIPTIRYLFKQAVDVNVEKNLTERNEILRQLRELKNDRAIEQMLPKPIYDKVMFIINDEILPNIR